jgi:hypothetical protein
MRLLAALGGLWMTLLLIVVEPWASSHMVRWWIGALADGSATLCLLIGALAVASRRKLFILSTLYGAIVVSGLGLASVLTQGEHSGASLLFAIAFFALTVSIPLFAVVLSVYELWRLRLQNHEAPGPPLGSAGA